MKYHRFSLHRTVADEKSQVRVLAGTPLPINFIALWHRDPGILVQNQKTPVRGAFRVPSSTGRDDLSDIPVARSWAIFCVACPSNELDRLIRRHPVKIPVVSLLQWLYGRAPSAARPVIPGADIAAHQRAITIVIASTARKAITKSSLRCDGLRILMCHL